jgi:hypothetical protein
MTIIKLRHVGTLLSLCLFLVVVSRPVTGQASAVTLIGILVAAPQYNLEPSGSFITSGRMHARISSIKERTGVVRRNRRPSLGTSAMWWSVLHVLYHSRLHDIMLHLKLSGPLIYVQPA